MVWRQLNGVRGGVNGGWISKPGYDVTTCNPGDFLLDTSSQVFQCVQKGNNSLLTLGNFVTSPGTRTTTVSLPAIFSSYTNLIVQGTFYSTTPGGSYSNDLETDPYCKYNASSGVLTISIVNVSSLGPIGADPNNYPTYWLAWSIFRGQF
jgi:hypothetical protein